MDGHAILIQSDWNEYIDQENVWVTWKKRGEKGKHGKIIKGGSTVDLEHFTSRLLSPGVLELKHQDTDTVKIVSAVHVFKNLQGGKAVTCMDVSSGGLGVSCGDASVIHIWDSSNGIVRRQLCGHKADVYSVRWFPSGQVVLSAGADMQLKIWSATDGSCAVSLIGHRQAVTDTAIVDKGRNILSVSKDGDVRLWHCGEARCICVVASVEDVALSCFISSDVFTDNLEDFSGEEGEVGTGGKVLAVGGEGGSLSLVNVARRKVISSVRHTAAVNSVDLSRELVLAGLDDGHVVAYHPTDLSKPTLETHDSNSPVLCVRALKGGVAVARKDGTVTLYLGKRRVELTGPDSEAVYSLAVDNDSLYTSCRDGSVRKYLLKTITQM